MECPSQCGLDPGVVLKRHEPEKKQKYLAHRWDDGCGMQCIQKEAGIMKRTYIMKSVALFTSDWQLHWFDLQAGAFSGTEIPQSDHHRCHGTRVWGSHCISERGAFNSPIFVHCWMGIPI
eukprot:scaffold52563_cov31-Attheya_sp.AAC.1